MYVVLENSAYCMCTNSLEPPFKITAFTVAVVIILSYKLVLVLHLFISECIMFVLVYVMQDSEKQFDLDSKTLSFSLVKTTSVSFRIKCYALCLRDSKRAQYFTECVVADESRDSKSEFRMSIFASLTKVVHVHVAC